MKLGKIRKLIRNVATFPLAPRYICNSPPADVLSIRSSGSLTRSSLSAKITVGERVRNRRKASRRYNLRSASFCRSPTRSATKRFATVSSYGHLSLRSWRLSFRHSRLVNPADVLFCRGLLIGLSKLYLTSSSDRPVSLFWLRTGDLRIATDLNGASDRNPTRRTFPRWQSRTEYAGHETLNRKWKTFVGVA